jgi:multiple sugar transport system permease protein
MRAIEQFTNARTMKNPSVNWGGMVTILFQGALTFFIVVLVLAPFFWIVSTSFKADLEVVSPNPTLFPKQLVLAQYIRLLVNTKYMLFFRNSVIVGLGSVVLTLFVSCLAAYGLHRPSFPGKMIISRVFLASYLFPGILLLLPLYQMFSELNFIDTPISLIVVNVAFSAPLCTWLIASFLRFVPREVEEAAMMDGASRLYVLTNVILPLLRPGLAAVSIYAFIASWQEYMFASIFIIRDDMKTLPLGLATLIDQYQHSWGLLAAGATTITLPVIVLFALMGRRFVEGLIYGAVKG